MATKKTLPSGKINVEYSDTVKANYYDPVTNAIILDKALQDYPEAKQTILRHELQHWMHHNKDYNPLETFILDMYLDLKTDYLRYAGIDKTTNPYMANKDYRVMKNMATIAVAALGNYLRMVAAIVIMPVAATHGFLRTMRRKL